MFSRNQQTCPRGRMQVSDPLTVNPMTHVQQLILCKKEKSRRL